MKKLKDTNKRKGKKFLLSVKNLEEYYLPSVVRQKLSTKVVTIVFCYTRRRRKPFVWRNFLQRRELHQRLVAFSGTSSWRSLVCAPPRRTDSRPLYLLPFWHSKSKQKYFALWLLSCSSHIAGRSH